MSEWISIKKEMPKTGLKVIAFYKNNHGMSRTIMAFYAEKLAIENHGDIDSEWCDYSEDADCYYLPVGWHEQLENWPEYTSVIVDDVFVPTHWMRLPEPPK